MEVAAADLAELKLAAAAAHRRMCWLTGRPVSAGAELTASCSGQDCPLPLLRPWS